MRGTTTATNSVMKYLKNRERRGRVTEGMSDNSSSEPIWGVPASFDYPVGAKQHGGFVQVDAKQLSRPEIHDQFEFGRLKNREIGGAFAAQNPVGVGREPEIGRPLVRAIAQQSAGVAIFAPTEHRRQPLRDGGLGNLVSVHHREGVREDEQRIRMRVAPQSKRAVQFVCAGEGHIMRHDTELLGGFPGCAPLRLFSRMIGIRQNGELAQIREDLLEQLNPLSRQLKRKEGRAGEIAARLPEAFDEAELYR